MSPARQSGPVAQEHYVLLVEDETLIRALLAEELRNLGLRVVEAATADEAWSYLSAGGQAHMVFSDIAMPGSMNGVELVRRIREQYPEMKAIITSGNAGPNNFSSLALFLPKPYRLDAAAQLTLKTLGLRIDDDGE